MMTQHQMVALMVQVANMEISLMTATIQMARITKMVTKMFLAVEAMMTDSQLIKANSTTAKNVEDRAITKMAKIKVMTSGQTMTANALATANDSAKS